ncbi:LysM peptidoglycan-binding domain-containing protein [Micromonospora sp. WMMD730]|uniref:LysM peptidoglycan-binding domain-containing protein n=1 Tax=Micromonospora sp. WMMD730 TaxID=3404128 RepID=UPI003B9674A6
MSSDRGDRLAEYGTRVTVHPPHGTPDRRIPLSRTVVTGARVVTAAGILLVVVPAVLWLAGGNPLRRLPEWSQIPAWFERSSGRFTPDVLIGAAFWVMWLLWAVFALLLVAELVTALTRWRIPALTLPSPLHRLVFGLAGTAALAVTSAGSVDAAATPDRPSTPAAAAEHVDVPRQASASGPAIIQVADQRYLYTVERHDTLSKVAREWLGDANRWPQICQLNKHRHFPGTGGTLRDCNLIYPGWELRLPADARPPHAANPATPTTPPPQTPHRPVPPPASASADPQPPRRRPHRALRRPHAVATPQRRVPHPAHPAPVHPARQGTPDAADRHRLAAGPDHRRHAPEDPRPAHPLPKGTTRAYQRHRRPAPDVRIVRIAPRPTTTPEPSPPAGTRIRAKPDHRFWVFGHERQQAYGPGRSLRRPVDIHPFLISRRPAAGRHAPPRDRRYGPTVTSVSASVRVG